VLVASYLVAPYAPRSWNIAQTGDDARIVGPTAVVGSGQDARERRRAEIREVHLRALQPVLRADAEQIQEIARRVRAEGRATRSIVASQRTLSDDLQNHYPEYAQARERLRRSVSEQEEEFRRAASLVTTSLPPGAVMERRRSEIARALLVKCQDLGPGMTLTATASDDERAAFEAFTSFRPDATVGAHCESLKRRAAGIVSSARKLATEARALAEHATLPGECRYTSQE
jgi:hypothetical protein